MRFNKKLRFNNKIIKMAKNKLQLNNLNKKILDNSIKLTIIIITFMFVYFNYTDVKNIIFNTQNTKLENSPKFEKIKKETKSFDNNNNNNNEKLKKIKNTLWTVWWFKIKSLKKNENWNFIFILDKSNLESVDQYSNSNSLNNNTQKIKSVIKKTIVNSFDWFKKDNFILKFK